MVQYNRQPPLRQLPKDKKLSISQREAFLKLARSGNDGCLRHSVSPLPYTLRELYTMLVGNVPTGFKVKRLCSDTSCISPTHLSLAVV